MGAVAAQRRGQDVDRGLGVGGFGGDDAVRIGFGGGQIDMVFHPPAGQGDVKQLAGQGSGADDVAGVSGGESLRGVDGGRISERDMLFHVVSGQAHHCSAAQVSGFNAAVVAGFDDLVAVAVADIVIAADMNSSRVASGANQIAWGCRQSVRKNNLFAVQGFRVCGGEPVEAGAGIEGVDDVVGRGQQNAVFAGVEVGGPRGVGHVSGGVIGADMDSVVVDVEAQTGRVTGPDRQCGSAFGGGTEPHQL